MEERCMRINNMVPSEHNKSRDARTKFYNVEAYVMRVHLTMSSNLC